MNRAHAITLNPAASCVWIQAWLVDLFAAAAPVNDYPPVQRPADQSIDVNDIQSSRMGDGEAYARLVKRYTRQVAQRMWKFTRSPQDLDELVQEVFVEAYFSLSRYRERHAFGGWLNRIATRVGYRYWKHQRRAAGTVSLQDWDGPDTRDPSPADPDRSADRLHALLSMLGPRDRLVLTLLYWEQYSTAEVATQTGWTHTMVKVQAHRARKRMKKLLENTRTGK